MHHDIGWRLHSYNFAQRSVARSERDDVELCDCASFCSGVYLRVMQLTRDEVIASIARAARAADGLAANGENPIKSWTAADTEQAGLA